MPLPHRYWWIPLLLFAVIIPFSPFLDLTVSGWFYHDGFIYGDNTFFATLYRYGEFPALIAGALALVLFLATFLLKSVRCWRQSSLLVVLTLVLGAGVITNAALKDNWGRPRPREVVQFGGSVPFQPMYNPQFGKHQYKSFTCGHCTMGFFFFSLILVGWRSHRRWITVTGTFLTCFLGISLSLARIAQGGHFFSDTLGSALVMWLTVLFVNWLIPVDPEESSCPS